MGSVPVAWEWVTVELGEWVAVRVSGAAVNLGQDGAGRTAVSRRCPYME